MRVLLIGPALQRVKTDAAGSIEIVLMPQMTAYGCVCRMRTGAVASGMRLEALGSFSAAA